MTQFNSIQIIISYLEDLGYHKTQDWVNSSLGPGDYCVNYSADKSHGTYIRVRTHSEKWLRFYLIRVEGQRLLFHGNVPDHPNSIDLADPGSLDLLRTILSDFKRPHD